MAIFRRLVESDSSQVYPFVFKITTSSANTQFTVPLVDYAGLTPSLTISWGDGGANSPLITSSTSADRIHTYSSAGTYTITISGFMPGFRVDNSASIRSLITELVQWGIVGLRVINFYGCNNLTAIPGSASLSGVGGYTGLEEVISFVYFMRSTGITSIPSDLFAYSPNATTFTDTFSSTPITTIPSGLFTESTLATTFASCFFNCTSLTSAPSDLFDACPSVTSFSATFRNCRALTNVLQFTNNQNVSTFNNVYNMSSTTNALSGTAPSLWTRTPTPSGVDAFNNCIGLTNYASIPLNFK